MEFSVTLTPDSVSGLQPGEQARYGVILLDEFRERLAVPIDYWAPDDYQRHWREAVRRILVGEERSCLITGMYDPGEATFIRWWLMYLDGGSVRVQNQILFIAEEAPDFQEANPFLSVPPRTTVSEDGTPLSEWVVSLSALQEWYEKNAPE
jgi:hypothetical protein